MTNQRSPHLIHKSGPASPSADENVLTYEHWLGCLAPGIEAPASQQPAGESWSVKIQHQGRRHTFSIFTGDKPAAAVQAKAIYETILAEGWDAALTNLAAQTQDGFLKTDPAYWKETSVATALPLPGLGRI